MNRTAGFERHLEEKMRELGYDQGRYEVDMRGGMPVMRMNELMFGADLNDLARRLAPDFNARVRLRALEFAPVNNLWLRTAVARELLAVAKEVVAMTRLDSILR